jgi:hypothetical protein
MSPGGARLTHVLLGVRPYRFGYQNLGSTVSYMEANLTCWTAGFGRERRFPAELPRSIGIWKEHPEYSARQIKADMGLEHPLGLDRTWQFLRECRMDVAKRSAVQTRVGWYIDRQTAARARIGAIWKRHPEFTAKQVMERLEPRHSVREKWVMRVMNECWRAYARPSPKQLRAGRRAYYYWRAR